MPPVVAAIGNALLVVFGGSSAAATAAAYIAAQAIVTLGTQFAINAATRAFAPKKPKGQGGGPEVTYSDTAAPIVLLYGEARIAGMHVIPPLTSGSENEYLHQIHAIGMGEMESITDVYFDDLTIASADIGAITGADTDGLVGGSTKFNGQAWIRRYTGSSTQTRDFIIGAVSGTAFTTDFRGRGIANVQTRLKWNDKVYSSIPQITYKARGFRLYDPRLDNSQPGGSGSHVFGTPSTHTYSNNPALALAHYLCNTVFGGGYAFDEVDWSTVMTAASACDALVNIPGATTQARYTCNGALFATDEFPENVTRLAEAMLGRVIFRDGQWRMYAGGWHSASFTVEQEDITGPVTLQFEGGREARFNRVRCWYQDAARGFQRHECQPRSNATYKTADGNEDIDTQIEQILCTGEFEAQRKAEFTLRSSRNQIIISLPLGPKMQNIALWETGVINWDEFGWTSKTFRCVGFEHRDDGGVFGTFREEQSADWDDMAAGDYGAPSTAVLPVVNDTKPGEPLNFTAVPQINGSILFSWNQPIVRPTGTQYRIIRATVSTDASGGTAIWNGDAEQIAVVCPSSPHGYFVQAYVGSSFGPYQPNTLGLVRVTRLEADQTLQYRFVGDGDFRFGASSSLWTVTDTYGGGAGQAVTGIASYSATGGNPAGGFVNLIATNSSAAFGVFGTKLLAAFPYDDRGVPIGYAPFGVEIRGRVRVNSQPSGGSGVVALCFWSNYTSPANDFEQLQSAQLNIESADYTLGEWRDYIASRAARVHDGDLSSNQSSRSNFHARSFVAFTGSGSISVADFQVTAFGARNSPIENRVLSVTGAAWEWNMVMKHLVFASTSLATNGVMQWSGDEWKRLPAGAHLIVSKINTAQNVYCIPSSGMLQIKIGTPTLTGTITMPVGLTGHAEITKTNTNEFTFTGAGLA